MSLSSSKAGVFEIKWLLYSRRFYACQQKSLLDRVSACGQTPTLKNPASGYLKQGLRTTSSGDEERFIFDFKRADGQNVKICNWNECSGA